MKRQATEWEKTHSSILTRGKDIEIHKQFLLIDRNTTENLIKKWLKIQIRFHKRATQIAYKNMKVIYH